MKVSMPVGNDLGWGIAGRYLTQEISRLSHINGVTLHCIPMHDFEPLNRDDWNDINIGYCFFEHDILAYNSIPKASKQWDFIVAGSRWCEYHLRLAGVRNTTTILQGVDQILFPSQGKRPEDAKFVVFSGGKFEFRKGQDIVIAAMRIFMERHADVWLSSAWHNHWDYSIKTMEQSKYIVYKHRNRPCDQIYRDVLAENGLDMSRVILHGQSDNASMSRIYAESDIGLFPNRCEGGNNMVMCEYMASGRPVIASNWSGHADVLTLENAFCLAPQKPVIARINGYESGVWFEASVDEVLEKLEQAYQNKSLTQHKAEMAVGDIQKLTWSRAAEKFHAISQHLAVQRCQWSSKTVVSHQLDAQQLFLDGKYELALKEYQQLLQKQPLDPEVHNDIGTVFDRMGRFTEALLHYSKSLALRPGVSDTQYNLANTLKRLGKTDESIDILNQLVASRPDYVNAWQNLGVNYFEIRDFPQAASCFERVVELEPDRSGCYASLGEIYHQWGEHLQRGIECLRIALEQQPGVVDLLNLKGLLHHELNQFPEAEQCYQEGLAKEPDNTILLNNIGNLFLAQARPEKAEYYLNLALRVEPENRAIRFNRAVARLLRGDYQRGLDDYEARFDKLEPVIKRHTELPVWQGENLDGKTLLVWAEQVYGDTIQFARYLPLLSKKNGVILFECLDVALAPLFIRLAGINQLIVRGQQLPKVDFQIPLASLPRVLGTMLDSIPCADRYLWPDQERLANWSDKINRIAGDSKMKVGLVWGGRKPRLNAGRSMTFQQLEPLVKLEQICWFSLQTGDDKEQLQGTDVQIVDLSDEMHDFADTAAIMASLDLVVSIDTASAHLAGALGVPVWVMLKSYPDWRWLLERQDSPWYTSARIFRQQKPDEWGPVVLQIEKELKSLLDESKKTVKE